MEATGCQIQGDKRGTAAREGKERQIKERRESKGKYKEKKGREK